MLGSLISMFERFSVDPRAQDHRTYNLSEASDQSNHRRVNVFDSVLWPL